MKIITSVTFFNDAVGMRMSATYSEVDETTGRIIKDNQRFDRVITNSEIRNKATDILDYATESIPE